MRTGGAAGLTVVVGTDGSPSAQHAVSWAADLSDRFDAELFLVHVTPRHEPTGGGDGSTEPAGCTEESLATASRALVGARGHARVVLDDDCAAGLVRVAEEEHADIVVVGNVGMSGRGSFLLGNVPNRVSHLAHCTVVIVNTSGAVSAGGPRSSPHGPAVHAPEQLLTSRAAHIGRVLGRAGIRELRARRGARGLSDADRGRMLREQLEELGPTFCKLGQVLSTRPDLLPEAYIRELATLQDHVRPLEESVVVAVMEQELGVPWEDVFETIDPTPLAAGTIAQVHRATLTSGDRVVVKVQRPDASELIRRDLSLLEAFARRVAARPSITSIVDVSAIVHHLSESLERELDFRQEAANLERMREVIARYPRLGVPRVHPELSTRRLLVMEEIRGVPIAEAPDGAPRREVARQLVESYYEQVLTAGFFHADPHPGNLMWFDDRLYFLDLGMVGEVGPGLREDLLLLLLAFWKEDAAFLTELALGMAGTDPPTGFDAAAFQEDMAELLARSRRVPLQELQIGALLQDMTQLSIRHGVRLPSELVLAGKALAQMQLATACLDPDLDPFAVAGRFALRTSLESARRVVDVGDVLFEARKLRARVLRALESFERLAGARPGDKLQVQLRGIEGVESSVRRAGRRLALAFTAAAGLVSTAIVAASENVARSFSVLLGGLSAVLVAWLLIDVVRRA